MIERKTSIGQIEVIPATGHVFVELHVQLYEDGHPTGTPSYHRVSIDPDHDIDERMAAVHADMKKRKIGPPLADLSDVHAHAKIARKPHLVEAFKAERARQIAEREASAKAADEERARAQGNTPEVPIPGRSGLPT